MTATLGSSVEYDSVSYVNSGERLSARLDYSREVYSLICSELVDSIGAIALEREALEAENEEYVRGLPHTD